MTPTTPGSSFIATGRSASLVPYIHGDFRVVTDADRDQPADRVALARFDDSFRDLRQDPVTNGSAFQ